MTCKLLSLVEDLSNTKQKSVQDHIDLCLIKFQGFGLVDINAEYFVDTILSTVT